MMLKPAMAKRTDAEGGQETRGGRGDSTETRTGPDLWWEVGGG